MIGRTIIAAIVLLSAGPTVRLFGQVSVHATVGARFTTALVHDVIVEPVEANRPLRCVQYRIGDKQALFDSEAFGRWLTEMQGQYRLASYETYPIPRFDKREQVLVTVDYIDVLKFVPRATASGVQTADLQADAPSGGAFPPGIVPVAR